MTTATAPLGRRPRRIQRFVVGLAMSAVVFVLERLVSRTMKRTGPG
jgi:hypothetical protein